MNRILIRRWVLYILGMATLAMGIILNTKANLGVSAIISVSYGVSEIYNLNFGDVTFAWYFSFVLLQIFIHFISDKKDMIIRDILQIPVSLIFTRFLNIFSSHIPMLSIDVVGPIFGSMWSRFICLFLAIVLTGIGAAMSLNANLVPNPGDGIVQTIADYLNKNVGFIKNCWDIFCVSIICIIGLLNVGKIVGVGIGTICAMIGVGRVMAIYNSLFKK